MGIGLGIARSLAAAGSGNRAQRLSAKPESIADVQAQIRSDFNVLRDSYSPADMSKAPPPSRK